VGNKFSTVAIVIIAIFLSIFPILDLIKFLQALKLNGRLCEKCKKKTKSLSGIFKKIKPILRYPKKISNINTNGFRKDSLNECKTHFILANELKSETEANSLKENQSYTKSVKKPKRTDIWWF
jgi:hypothetical protein